MTDTTSNTTSGHTSGPTNLARDTRYGGLVSAPTEASVSAPLQQMALVDLLDDAQVERFTRTATDLGERHVHIRLEVGGPWPPYSFSSLDAS